MSDRASKQAPAASRKFLPRVSPLESRLLLSTTFLPKDTIVWYANPPRKGGIAIQSGSVLSCVVGQPRTNSVQIADDGRGDVRMSWNFGRPQAFTGVTTTIIQAQRARSDQFTFVLTHGDTVTAVAASARFAFQHSGPSTRSGGIELGVDRPSLSASDRALGHDLTGLHFVHGGTAVQNGTELTVIARRPGMNIVRIASCLGGSPHVEVAWNGGTARNFTGVSTIVVDTHNARKDQVSLRDMTVS
jgi:hypothetical protein